MSVSFSTCAAFSKRKNRKTIWQLSSFKKKQRIREKLIKNGAKQHKLPHLSAPPRWWPPDFTGIICLPRISPMLKLFTQKETDAEIFQGVLLSPESDAAKETEAYDRYVKPPKKRSGFWDKGTVSLSTPVFTGQFNGRPNITTLSLTRLSHVFLIFPRVCSCHHGLMR